jgi:hypothetical protein
VRQQRGLEEVPGCADVSPLGHIHIDDLAVLIHGPAHVPPHAGNLHICLIHEPPIPNAVTTWSCRVDELWREALYPAVDGDVINLDAAFCEEFLDIAVGESVSEIPAHCQQDHFRRKPVPGERIRLNTATTIHPHRLPELGPIRQRNS